MRPGASVARAWLDVGVCGGGGAASVRAAACTGGAPHALGCLCAAAARGGSRLRDQPVGTSAPPRADAPPSLRAVGTQAAQPKMAHGRGACLRRPPRDACAARDSTRTPASSSRTSSRGARTLAAASQASDGPFAHRARGAVSAVSRTRAYPRVERAYTDRLRPVRRNPLAARARDVQPRKRLNSRRDRAGAPSVWETLEPRAAGEGSQGARAVSRERPGNRPREAADCGVTSSGGARTCVRHASERTGVMKGQRLFRVQSYMRR